MHKSSSGGLGACHPKKDFRSPKIDLDAIQEIKSHLELFYTGFTQIYGDLHRQHTNTGPLVSGYSGNAWGN